MKSSFVDEYGKYLQDLFLYRINRAAPPGLARHMKACASCRELFFSLAMADRELARECGVDTNFSFFESQLLWSNISQGLGLASTEGRKFWSSKSLVVTTLSSALLVLGFLFGLSHFAWNSPRSDQGMARGVHAKPLVEFYCLQSGQEPRRLDAGHARCGIDDTLAFSYLNPDGEYSGIALFALDAHNRPLWYFPDPIHTKAVSVETTSRPKALDKTVRLTVNHKPGVYTLYYLFTRRPLSFDELKHAIDGMTKGAPPPERSILHKMELKVDGSR